MKKPQVIFSLLFLIVIVALYLLTTGSSILLEPIDLGLTRFPAGTLITWLGLIALPSCIYFGARRMREPESKFDQFVSKSLRGILIMALLWVPISYLLAGNLSFSFSGNLQYQGGPTASRIFFVFTYGIVLSSLAITVLLSILSLSRRAVGKPKANEGKRK